MANIDDLLGKLEVPCQACKGEGYIGGVDDDGMIHENVCPECRGKKYMPSEVGRKLLDFIRKYLCEEQNCRWWL
ncbi:hypothetical protein [Desulfofundulus salinus]|uniref:Tryptophan RNA-binding attenuation protein n=1 Tax=Desulfofundulus salinus TaxID=2419843 RepID=A0A494WUP3_9FIRM|nr:hypothetical protein [Desulfofundulus salinum]RKO67148.1 hypothetical protein D7024_09425 [Desulfofundulus salinum]